MSHLWGWLATAGQISSYTSQLPLARELENILPVKTRVEGVHSVLSIPCNSHLTMPGRATRLKKGEEWVTMFAEEMPSTEGILTNPDKDFTGQKRKNFRKPEKIGYNESLWYQKKDGWGSQEGLYTVLWEYQPKWSCDGLKTNKWSNFLFILKLLNSLPKQVLDANSLNRKDPKQWKKNPTQTDKHKDTVTLLGCLWAV